ncbi:MAG: type VII secretion EssA family protein [Sporolactobacillus sp.]
MRRKIFKSCILTGVMLFSYTVVAGFDGDSATKVQPNHFQKQKTTIDPNEINTNVSTYHKIPVQVQRLTFKEPHTDEKFRKTLFLTPGKRDKVNVTRETNKMGLFH